MRPWVPLIFIITLPMMAANAAFLSLDMLDLLFHNYEFWFITVLSIFNWVGLALIFDDVRAIVCVGTFSNAPSIIAIDANYRMYPTMAKTIVVAGPAMLILTVCCAYRLVVDSSYPTLELGGLVFHSRQIVIFTSSTLALFIVKKAYFKYRRMGVRPDTGESGVDTPHRRHIIPCVVLQARLRLDPVAIQPRLTANQDSASPRVANILEATGATPPPGVTSAPQIQQLRLSNDKAFVVDARRTVVRRLLELVNSYHQMTTTISFFGVLGLLATTAVWVLLLQHDQTKANERLALAVAVIAAACTLLFTSATVALSQRDLLRLLVWNFDVVFSTLQGTALAVCLLDLLRWRAAPSLAVVSWWLWFHWLLVLDALTPIVAHQLRLRKFFALPAILLVLAVAFVSVLELLVGSSTVFSPRLLWSLRVTSFGDFDLHTDTLAVQRVVTIVGWSSRLVIELAVSDQNQLVYIRRHINYVSPYATF
ncbi:hypothetical protein BBJ28_00017812 [Nothophytophthora sp. Chile5]|nr:hypothetical protein BBJ28_00017812 [Nothophytophthora sp. Chile5]